MCLNPRKIKNKRYVPTKKNEFNPPPAPTEEVRYVEVGCGICSDCRRKRQNEWMTRLNEEYDNGRILYCTFTLNEKYYHQLRIEVGNNSTENRENAIMTRAVRLYLELWRKRHKQALKHWFITELGGETGRIHIHGMVFGNYNIDDVKNAWIYGLSQVEILKSKRGLNYVLKYVTKKSIFDRNFIGKIMCSPGIGRGYEEKYDAKRNKFNAAGATDCTYRLVSGKRVMLPAYYKRKIYSDEEREQLYIQNLEKNVAYVGGEEIPGRADVERIREYYRRRECIEGLEAETRSHKRNKLKQRTAAHRAAAASAAAKRLRANSIESGKPEN